MRSLSIPAISKMLPPIIMAFIATDILLCLGYVTNYLLGQPFSKATALLDLNGEHSLPAWYSSMQFFFIFLLSTIYVINTLRQDRKSILLICLPAMFLLMSIDESVQIHEWLGRRSDVLLTGGSRDGTLFQQTGIWMFVIGFPFLVLFLFWAYSVKKYVADNPAVNKLVAGLCIMLAGALGCEFFSNFIDGSFVVAELVCEEGLEMIGATVMLWSVYDMSLQYMPGIESVLIQPGLRPASPVSMAPEMALDSMDCTSSPKTAAVSFLTNCEQNSAEAVPLAAKHENGDQIASP